MAINEPTIPQEYLSGHGPPRFAYRTGPQERSMTMPLPLIQFPGTILRPSTAGALIPWFGPLLLLRPPSLEPEPESALSAAGLLRQIAPQAGAEAAGGKAGELAALLKQWEQWVRDHVGSADLAALKAGVKPPPPPETVRGLMSDIKQFGKPEDGQPAPPPEVTADLFLHVAHIRDREALEIDGMLGKVDEGQERLSESIGINQEDAAPADYKEAFMERMPPLEYDLDDQKHPERRLASWAVLAQSLGPEAADAWLATANLPAIQVLMERHNNRLSSLGIDFRSPAGATMPGLGVGAPPPADSPLAQEAARLVLPDLSGLDQEGLVELRAKLMAQDEGHGLTELQQGVAGLLAKLSREKWSSDLRDEVSAQARELAEKATVLAAQVGVDGPGRGISILVFPGLSRQDLLALMRSGDAGASPLPAPEAWPQDWPAGSCPVVVPW